MYRHKRMLFGLKMRQPFSDKLCCSMVASSLMPRGFIGGLWYLVAERGHNCKWAVRSLFNFAWLLQWGGCKSLELAPSPPDWVCLVYGYIENWTLHEVANQFLPIDRTLSFTVSISQTNSFLDKPSALWPLTRCPRLWIRFVLPATLGRSSRE